LEGIGELKKCDGVSEEIWERDLRKRDKKDIYKVEEEETIESRDRDV